MTVIVSGFLRSAPRDEPMDSMTICSDPIAQHSENRMLVVWCSGQDLNLHAFRQRLLRPSCMPFHHPSPKEDTCPSQICSASIANFWIGMRAFAGPLSLCLPRTGVI